MHSEFGFELRVCAWAEQQWPPASSDGFSGFVARQLGTKRRRWDTILTEVDPDAFAARAEFGEKRLDSDLLHLVQHAPAEWEYYRDALPHPGYPWRYVREAIHRASDRGVLDERRDGNKIEIRRIAPYPDWVDRIVAIENKPDLTASAARDLKPQLERDVALGLADEVWLATEATDGRIEPALLEETPVEVGILAFDRSEAGVSADDGLDAEVVWHPRTLDTAAPGTRILDRPSGSKYDQSAAQFEYVSPEEKAERRLAIAERAYERGWRSYADTMRPDCRHFDLERGAHGYLPYCQAKRREQTAAECSGSCAKFQPEPPAWRQCGWPIEGGPGKAVKRLLAERRQRTRNS